MNSTTNERTWNVYAKKAGSKYEKAKIMLQQDSISIVTETNKTLLHSQLANAQINKLNNPFMALKGRGVVAGEQIVNVRFHSTLTYSVLVVLAGVVAIVVAAAGAPYLAPFVLLGLVPAIQKSRNMKETKAWESSQLLGLVPSGGIISDPNLFDSHKQYQKAKRIMLIGIAPLFLVIGLAVGVFIIMVPNTILGSIFPDMPDGVRVAVSALLSLYPTYKVVKLIYKITTNDPVSEQAADILEQQRKE